MQSGFCDTLPENFLTDFITENPDIRTSIKSFHRDRLMEAMGESSIKIWLCTRPYDGDIFETLYERKTKLFLIVGRNHPLAGRKSVGMGELSRYSYCQHPLRSGASAPLRASMSEVGAAPQYLLDPADRPLTMGLVSRGAAVSFHAGPVLSELSGYCAGGAGRHGCGGGVGVHRYPAGRPQDRGNWAFPVLHEGKAGELTGIQASCRWPIALRPGCANPPLRSAGDHREPKWRRRSFQFQPFPENGNSRQRGGL